MRYNADKRRKYLPWVVKEAIMVTLIKPIRNKARLRYVRGWYLE